MANFGTDNRESESVDLWLRNSPERENNMEAIFGGTTDNPHQLTQVQSLQGNGGRNNPNTRSPNRSNPNPRTSKVKKKNDAELTGEEEAKRRRRNTMKSAREKAKRVELQTLKSEKSSWQQSEAQMTGLRKEISSLKETTNSLERGKKHLERVLEAQAEEIKTLKADNEKLKYQKDDQDAALRVIEKELVHSDYNGLQIECMFYKTLVELLKKDHTISPKIQLLQETITAKANALAKITSDTN